jgi:hypothetical protein
MVFIPPEINEALYIYRSNELAELQSQRECEMSIMLTLQYSTISVEHTS